MSATDPNAGPHTCIASTVQTEPSPCHPATAILSVWYRDMKSIFMYATVTMVWAQAGPACMVTLTRHSYGSFVVHQSSTPPSDWATGCLLSPLLSLAEPQCAYPVPCQGISWLLSSFANSAESHFKHLSRLSHGHEFLSDWRMCNARPLAWCHQHHWVENGQAQHTIEVVFA